MNHLATMTYERAPALRRFFTFNHSCLATNHNHMNIIITSSHYAYVHTTDITRVHTVQHANKGEKRVPIKRNAGLRQSLTVIHMLVILLKALCTGRLGRLSPSSETHVCCMLWKLLSSPGTTHLGTVRGSY